MTDYTKELWRFGPSTRYHGDISLAWDIIVGEPAWWDPSAGGGGDWQYPDDHRLIATVYDADAARLMAHAPELLKELRGFVWLLSCPFDRLAYKRAVQHAQELIRRATEVNQ